MRKKFTSLALLFLFVGTTAFVVLRYNGSLKNKVNAFYPLKERKGPLAQAPEWASVKQTGDKLIRVVRETPGDTKSALRLATLYVQEGRATGDHAYYNAAALKYVDDVLAREPENFEALLLKALLQLSQHHFAEGLQTAEKARAINPYNAYVYGLITDAAVETGAYDAAVQSLDKMVSIRPDLRSYSRISYLREIHGDLPGAIEAMKQAVDAGYPGEESTAWARTQLAHLYALNGDAKAAETQYAATLQERPGYAYAVAGLGNLAVANRDYQKAISLYQQADTLLSDYSFREKLAEAYQLAGQTEKADRVLDDVIRSLRATADAGEEATAHHVDNELAWVYLLKKEYGKALDRALAEYRRRPKNIEVAETVAWAQYSAGNVEKALPYLRTALQTGSKNPTLLCRAGLIYRKAGDKAKAKALLTDGLKANPVIDPQLLAESRAALQTL